jgi:hypothetical protein
MAACPDGNATLTAPQYRDIPRKSKICLYFRVLLQFLAEPRAEFVWRLGTLAGLAVGIWLLAASGTSRPVALGPDAPAAQFSAARTDAVLGRLLEEQRPRPVGSAQNRAVHERILKELAALSVPAQTETAMSCYGERRFGALSCGTVSNILADVSEGSGKRIVLMAHMDSVAAGPGAGDDASGVATILETIRALKARNAASSSEAVGHEISGGHPIRVLFTDGEESGMLGAAAYLRDPVHGSETGAVINMESRGNQGPSYLFQTGPGDGRLIELYAHGVSHYAASSLYAEIYKVLPNDTDMTPFLAAGITGYNFAFIGNGGQYHTPLDRRENLDPRTLQQHGENALGVVQALRNADLDKLQSKNAIYLDILGRFLPRLPGSWALPLSIAVFFLIALASRGRFSLKYFLPAFAMPPLLILGAVAVGFGLHGLAAWISGEPDPSFAHPLYLRLSLAFGVFAMALLTARMAGAISCWLWFAILAIVCAIWAPGIAPYFLFPALVAAPLLLLSRWGGRGLALSVSAIVALVIWLSFNQGSEAIMGLRLHPLFMVSAGFGLITLLPLLAKERHLGVFASLSLVVAIALAAVAGLQPAYSSTAPERLNLGYVEQGGKAWWLADPVPRLPASLRAAADFSAAPKRLLQWAYIAPAGPARHPAPRASVSRNGDTLTLGLATDGEGIGLLVPAKAKLRAVIIGGVTTPISGGALSITCGTPDCASQKITLALGSSQPLELILYAYRHGLPREGAKLLKARPSWAVPERGGDITAWAEKIAVPAR